MTSRLPGYCAFSTEGRLLSGQRSPLWIKKSALGQPFCPSADSIPVSSDDCIFFPLSVVATILKPTAHRRRPLLFILNVSSKGNRLGTNPGLYSLIVKGEGFLLYFCISGSGWVALIGSFEEVRRHFRLSQSTGSKRKPVVGFAFR